MISFLLSWDSSRGWDTHKYPLPSNLYTYLFHSSHTHYSRYPPSLYPPSLILTVSVQNLTAYQTKTRGSTPFSFSIFSLPFCFSHYPVPPSLAPRVFVRKLCTYVHVQSWLVWVWVSEKEKRVCVYQCIEPSSRNSLYSFLIPPFPTRKPKTFKNHLPLLLSFFILSSSLLINLHYFLLPISFPYQQPPQPLSHPLILSSPHLLIFSPTYRWNQSQVLEVHKEWLLSPTAINFGDIPNIRPVAIFSCCILFSHLVLGHHHHCHHYNKTNHHLPNQEQNISLSLIPSNLLYETFIPYNFRKRPPVLSQSSIFQPSSQDARPRRVPVPLLASSHSSPPASSQGQKDCQPSDCEPRNLSIANLSIVANAVRSPLRSILDTNPLHCQASRMTSKHSSPPIAGYLAHGSLCSI